MATRNQRSQKPKTSKSSLVSHTFPPFYACYLLKSIKNPKSTATYIGSTPHPPRRIRQHNGEITQGAWKTARNRPWVMSMIVHGFPSKLAALQFEWAWQHPNLSRHLKGGDVTKGRTLKGNIAVARSMLTTHPYTSWPLHVKLFTPEAVKGWSEACKDLTPLPPGFTFCVEIEGVDGKRDDVGSGRQGAIDVTDKAFTSEHLTKYTSVLSTGEPQACTICGSGLDFHKADPLSLALCPTHDCTAYAHLTCLAAAFLSQANHVSSEPSMIPRGGTCNQCLKYILWGDIVRGCYRRRTGGHGTVIEQSVIVEEAEQEGGDDGEVFEAEEPENHPKRKRTPNAIKTTRKVSPKRNRKKLQAAPLEEEEGEFFDLDAVSGSDSASSHSPRSSHPAKKAKPSPRARGRPLGSKSKPKQAVVPQEQVSGEFFDIDEFLSTDGSDAALSVGGKSPRRPKSKRKQPTNANLADALACMRILDHSDVDVAMDGLSPQQQARTRNRERGGKRGQDEVDLDVIEISD